MIQLKSQREIAKMRRAGLAVWQAHEIIRSMVEPGATTRAIDAEVERYFTRIGGEPLFKNYPHHDQGKPPFPAVTCCSLNEVVVHGVPNDEPLRDGDIISIDTGVRLGGWCGDAAWTYPVGEVAPDVQRLLDVGEATLNLAFELMGTKSRWSQIAAEMGRFVSDHGYSSVEDFVGHGVGRKMHEDPQVPNYMSRSLRGQGDFAIEPGLVIAVEPMVNMGKKKVKQQRDYWGQATADGKPSVHFEHTIAVTRDGPVRLTEAPSEAEKELVAS